MLGRLATLTILLMPPTFLAAQGTDGAINRTDAQGRKQGPWARKWAGSEQVRYTGQFKDDRPVGSFTYYSTEGKLDGTMTAYFADGTVAERRTFKAGKAEGPAEQFYANGGQRYKPNDQGGAPEGIETYYFPNGNKEIEGRYVNGDRDGGWTYYNEDGSVQMQVLYAQGRMVKEKYENGTFREYWADQQLKSEVTYRNGKREGPFTEWYNNGQWVEVPMKLGPQGEEKSEMERKLTGQTKQREGTYKNDLLEGPVKEYNDAGRLISTVVYKNGVTVNGAGGQ